MLTLKVSERNARKNTESLRESGVLPAVYYGTSTESKPIGIPIGDFKKIWAEAGEATIIQLDTPDGDKDALIHDVQFHPVSGEPVHADFYIVEKGQVLTVNVPLEFIGEAPGVTDAGGILTKVMHELEIESEPRNLPSHIDIDISGLLNVGDTFTVKDISLPAGVTTNAEPDEVIVSISEAQEEEEETPAEVNLEDIEVEKKGKEEEEGEGSEAGE